MRDDSKVIAHYISGSPLRKVGRRWYTYNHIYIYVSIDMADNTTHTTIIRRRSVSLNDRIINFFRIYASVQSESFFKNNLNNDGPEEKKTFL